MARLGPWDAARRVAVAVSGGPDSLALAVLAQAWGDPVAFLVDHGLRPESAGEAEAARQALSARGMPARILRLDGLAPGPGIAARARVARYAALTAACREAGLVDLLLGHHAGDQAETVLMRRRRGSGPAGLAGMAALVETDDIRLLRPLLGTDPAALRAVVAAAGLVPAEDPSNADTRSERVRLRQEIGADRAALLAEAHAAGQARHAAEFALADDLAARARLYPEGYAVLLPGPLPTASLGAVLRSVSGRRYPVDCAALAARPRAATLGGTRLHPAGRAGPGLLVTREENAMEPAILAGPGTMWDGRYRLAGECNGGVVGALGDDARPMRTRSGQPSAVLRSLPALRYNGVLSAVPHLGYRAPSMVVDGPAIRSACLPAAGAPFLPA